MTPGHSYLRGAGCHQQLCSPNTQGFILPPAQLPKESHVQGITASPASLPREESRGRSILLSCYLPARAGGGGEGPCLDPAFRDTWRNHNFLETLHLLELGGCSDKQGLCSIGSIRYPLQSEPRSHPGICGASSGRSSRAQEVPGQLQPGCILLAAPGVPPSRDAPFIHSHHSPTSQAALVLALAVVVFPKVPGFKLCIPIHTASSKTSLVSGGKHPQMCPQPPQLSLTLHFRVSSSHLFLTSPSPLLSLVPSSSG